MRLLTIIFLLMSHMSLAQNYYDVTNEIEHLIDSKKFEEANALSKNRISSGNYKNPDELNYLKFLETLASANRDAWIKNNHPAAVKAFDTATILLKKVSNISPVRRAAYHRMHAEYLFKIDRSPESLKVFEASLKSLLLEKKSKEIEIASANTYTSYAKVLISENDFSKGFDVLEKALKLYESNNINSGYYLAVAHHQIAYAYRVKGFEDNYLKHLLKSLDIAKERQDSESLELLTKVYELLVSNYTDYGKYEEAKSYLQDHEKVYNTIIAKKDSTTFDYSMVHARFVTSKIYLYSYIDEPKMLKALNELESYIDLNNLQNYPLETIYIALTAYGNSAIALRAFDEHQKAIEMNMLMIDVLKDPKFMDYRMFFYGNLGYVYSDLKNYEEALKYINLGIDGAKSLGYEKHDAYEALKMELLSKLNTSIDIDTNTLAVINKIVNKPNGYKTVQEIKYSDFNGASSEKLLLILTSIAKNYQFLYEEKGNQKDLKNAHHLFEVASDMFVTYYNNGIFNPSLSNLAQRVNDGLLATGFALKTANSAQVLIKVDNNTSRYLWNEFSLKNPNINFGEADDLIKKLEAANAEKNKIIAKRQQEPEQNSETYNAFTKSILKYEQEEERLSEKIRSINTTYSYQSKPSNKMADIQSRLKPNQTLLRYVVATSKVYLFAIDGQNLEFYELGERQELETKAKEFNSNLRLNSKDFSQLSQELNSILIPKAVHLNHNIIIVCDDFLNYIPFESLQKPSKEFLVQNHAISYANSLNFFNYQNNPSSKTDSRLVAFAPVYSNEPNPEDLKYVTRGSLYELKWAQEEAKTITNQFSGDLISGKNATKSRFLKDASNYKIIHLSMHSLLDESNPANSSLVFSDNEKLYFSELYATKMPADMAVLSACNTGFGSLKNGEGVMSMSRAFTFAGVKSTVYSLWQVPDKETSEIMVSFYENLKDGQAKDEALANAKLNFIKKNPMKNHPFYWAGFVVNGDVSPIATSGNNWMLYLGIAAILLLILVFFRKRLFQFSK